MEPGSSSQQRGVQRQLSSPNTTTNKKRNASNFAIDKAEVNADHINGIKCELCYQTQTENVDIPSNAESECVVLTNEILANIYTDESGGIQHNVTNFSIYDENKHMCPVDSGLIERNVPLYLTGYVKPVFDHGSSIENGIAVKDLGPILEWWLSSYDGGSQVRIGVCTDYADYILIEPHSSYKKYMASVTEKTHLSRQVLKCLLNSDIDDPTYEDVLNYIKGSINPATCNTFTEEDLIGHAQFVIDQVANYDSDDNHYLPLTETQCIQTLTELSGAINPGTSNRSERRGQRIRVKAEISSKREFSKATTTELVKDVFESMFAGQLNVDDKEETTKKPVNNALNNMCDERTIKIPSDDDVYIVNNQVMLKDQKLGEKMFILVKMSNSGPSFVGQIQYFHNASQKAHVQIFMHGYDTVLGDTADPQELFLLKGRCTDISIKNIIKIVDVTHKQPYKNWFNLGGSKLEDLLEPVNRDKVSFFYQLEYDQEFGRFEYPTFNDNSEAKKDKYCYSCAITKFKRLSQIALPLVFMEKEDKISYYEEFKLYDEVFSIGNFIYLQPGIFSNSQRLNFKKSKPFVHKEINKNKNNTILKIVDETMYPEYYRKTHENTMRGSNETTPDPFEIGEILAIYSHERDPTMLKLDVRRMYRAEHIPLEDNDKNTDMNLLFWSEEEFIVPTVNIYGKCFVVFIANIQEDPIVWSAGGPDRFYFTKQYDFLTGSVIPDYKLPCDAKLTGKEVFVNYNYNFVDKHKLQKIPSYKNIEPLRSLDIFAGCGGLSKGLEDSGLIESKWAIECDEKAATAFELNNPGSTVFVEDCNDLLNLAMSDCKTNDKNQRIPQKGDVEFICGGPPCQGFSGMNRFNSGEYSLFKNSLIVSFLSYIEYYRPKYFIMENVRNFASYKNGMLLKLVLRCITRIGYQCSFGILQAGNFGVPQTRRRLIIIASAPDERLPFYPEPIHVFNRKGASLSIRVGEEKYKTNCQYRDSAPMRTVTVYDAWSDLPPIQNGANLERINYKSIPITHLQRLLRYPNDRYSESVLTDHICKDMSPLVQARMEFIPIGEGSDWRDLPNVEIQLCDGAMSNKLVYTHNDIKNGALRGVCQCASGGPCNPLDKQSNTIIPWCLPHTGNRHNNWAGLYGRLAWRGYCSTTITNPEPMGKQGRVLHPEQHRVVSVRECARSQGFNDSFLFYGPIINKHRQIGNAVPPPMGVAIGREIIKAIEKRGNGVFIIKKLPCD